MTPPAHRAAERYIEYVNARDLEALVGLFAPDAALFHPIGEFAGHDAIRGFYADNILPHAPKVRATSWVDDGSSCVFEMEAEGAQGGVGHAIDHVTVDDEGRVARLAIYYR